MLSWQQVSGNSKYFGFHPLQTDALQDQRSEVELVGSSIPQVESVRARSCPGRCCGCWGSAEHLAHPSPEDG